MIEEPRLFRSPLYGWDIVVLAALAMIATLPGRTFGLGMITERLISDPSLGFNQAIPEKSETDSSGNVDTEKGSTKSSRDSILDANRKVFGWINSYATLIGAVFCIPTGWMLDRVGIRTTLTLVVALFGIDVLLMTNCVEYFQFAALLTLTRGLGQSALSVVSISMIGKWFPKTRLALPTALYSILVSVGFSTAFQWGQAQSKLEWRELWGKFGWILLGFSVICLLFVRSSPRLDSDGSSATAEDGSSPKPDSLESSTNFSFAEAIRTPAFWVFGFATSFYGLVSSGISLFNQSILQERGFAESYYYDLMKMTTMVGMICNLTTGILATRVSIKYLAIAAMVLLASALVGLPFVTNTFGLYSYGLAMGAAGGMVTVLFFTIWAQMYGKTHLGRIQGFAQMLTVFASALGPVVLAEVKQRTETYTSAIFSLSTIAAIMAVAIAATPLPRKRTEDADSLLPLVATEL